MPTIAAFLNQLCQVRFRRVPKSSLALIPLGVVSLIAACGDAGSTFTDTTAPGATPVEGMPTAPGAVPPTGEMTAPGDPSTAPMGSPGSSEAVGMDGLPLAPGEATNPMGTGSAPAPSGTPMGSEAPAAENPATETPMAGENPAPEAPPEVCPTGPVCHEFFANDNANNVVNYVNEFDPSKNWRAPVGVGGTNSPRQAEFVDNAEVVVDGPLNGKAVLVSINTGFQEYHPATGERLVDVRLAGTTDVRGAWRLPDGNTILGIGNDTMRTVDPTGATVRSCTLPGNGDLRALVRDPDGSILYGKNLDLFRVNETCQQLWTARLPAGSKAYNAVSRLGGVGGVWATSGGPTTVIEFDQQGQILRQLGGRNAHPNTTLDFFSGFKLLPNGNVVVANWQGYVGNPVDSTPHLVEFSPENELVWRWGNQTTARQITNVLVVR